MHTSRKAEKCGSWIERSRMFVWLPLLFAHSLLASGGEATPQFSIQDLGPIEAGFISNEGKVLGSEGIESHWLWEAGQRVRVNLTGASMVNRYGYVAGSVRGGWYVSSFGEYFPYDRASVWHDGVLTDLGTLGGRSSAALALNSHQVVVGIADDPDGQRQPFIWQDGVMSAIRINPPEAGWGFDVPLRVTR